MESSWIQEDDPHEGDKRCLLISISALFMMAAIISLFIVGMHFGDARKYCDSIVEAKFMIDEEFKSDFQLTSEQQLAFANNPELYFWDKCLFQTYPFNVVEERQCQCRVFVIDWNDLESTMEDRARLKLTQGTVLRGLLENNVMLEKFKSVGVDGSDRPFSFSPLHFRSVHMNAFEWRGSGNEVLSTDSLGTYIASWSELQYLSTNVASDFVVEGHIGLPALEILNLQYENPSNNQQILESLCQSRNLQIITLDGNIQAIPNCFSDLQYLKVFVADNITSLEAFPLSMLRLPEFEVFSIFNGNITWISFLDFNLPHDVDREDGSEVQAWLDTHFAFNADSEYYLQLNPICYEELDEMQIPLRMREWISSSCDYICSDLSNGHHADCVPRLVGDGKCDLGCNSPNCKFDNGDCLALCLVEELTDCSWDRLLNDQCDAECDNEFCSGFKTDAVEQGLADFGHCGTNILMADSCQEASLRVGNQSIQCQDEWIGDRLCDEVCDIAECSFDGMDCESVCDGICATAVARWMMTDIHRKFRLEHSAFCISSWSGIMAIWGEFEGSEDCLSYVRSVDFDGDQFINLREYSAMICQIQNGNSDPRALQINCAACVSPLLGVGKEFYDI